MKPKVLITLFVALGAVCSFARVVEDSKSRFVLDDVVVSTKKDEACSGIEIGEDDI